MKNSKQNKLSSFDRGLCMTTEEIEFELRGTKYIPWLDFLLNPRRLRGSDFLMRWSQGLWSEKRITEGINKTKRFFAIPYGTSSTAPEDDVRKYELYFELLDEAGHGNIKRPDLLIFDRKDYDLIQSMIKNIERRHKIPFILNENSQGQEYLTGEQIFPFIHENDQDMQTILSKSIIAVECENSLWKARMMPDFDKSLKPMKRLGNKPGLSKQAVVPTIIMKDEDRSPLNLWQNNTGIKIHLWHVFFDLAYGISLDRAEELIQSGLIEANIQTFQAPNGTTTDKSIYKFYYHYAYQLGNSLDEPTVVAKYIVDKNGHILPFVNFEGGNLEINQEALNTLSRIEEERHAIS